MVGDEQEPHKDGGEYDAPPADSSLSKSRMLVWLVAGSSLFIGGLNVGLYLFQCRHQHLEVSWLRCLWLSIPLVVGVVLLVKISALAGRIDDWLEQ